MLASAWPACRCHCWVLLLAVVLGWLTVVLGAAFTQWQLEAQLHNRHDLRDLIRQQLSVDLAECSSLERVATRLHRSERTLRRHLQQLNTSFQHLLDEVRYDKARQLLQQTDLPIHLIAGSMDPVGAKTKGVEQVAGQYRKAGVKSVTTHYYIGARHELLNETNRDEVTADVIAWLDAHLPS